MNNEEIEILKNHIAAIAKITDEEWSSFSSILSPTLLNKKECFLKAGEYCKTSAFVSSGLFKLYTTDAEGREKIFQFNIENTFLSDCDSYLNKMPSLYTIEALEKSEIIVFKNIDLEKICAAFPVFDKIGRHITHEILSYYKEHIQLLMTHSPQERYEYLMTKRPYLIQRVSVTHLAQYLGLTRETVSRLKSNSFA
jgi:CRP-like cAMP-binding protein